MKLEKEIVPFYIEWVNEDLEKNRKMRDDCLCEIIRICRTAKGDALPEANDHLEQLNEKIDNFRQLVDYANYVKSDAENHLRFCEY